MKFIQKVGAPRVFQEWRERVRDTNKEDYRELPAPEKEALLEALMAEQGWLCAYTMRRISATCAHVEHIKPQTLCRAEQRGSDLDYGNLVACFPREGMTHQYRYGAQARGDWWNPAQFVTPLQANCEWRFHFNLRGEIAAVSGDPGAAETLKRLALDHDSLSEDRKRVIEEFVYGEDGSHPLSQAEATRWIAQVERRMKDNRFIEFCVAIRHALEDYVRNLEKHRRKRSYARRAQQ